MRVGMKRNVNFGLLILIVATLMCFAAASIYYQVTFKSVSSEYSTKLSELQKVTSTLLQKKEELAETSATKESLEDKYTDIKGAKEELEDQVDSLESNLKSTKEELLDSQNDLRNEKALRESCEYEKAEFRNDLRRAESTIASLCNTLDDNSISSSSCDD